MSKPQCPLPPPYTLPAERTNIKHNFDTIERKWEYFLKIRHEDDILGIAEAYPRPDASSAAANHFGPLAMYLAAGFAVHRTDGDGSVCVRKPL